jgi:flagellar motor protein MotB
MVLDALLVATDTADLDDELIVLSLAVELLSKRKSADAQLLLSVAQNRLAKLTASYPSRDETIVIGGHMDRQYKKLVPIIATH